MQDIYTLKIFEWIDSSVLSTIIKGLKIEKFSSSEVIIQEWDESNWKAYIIKSWEVNVEISWEKRAILKTWDIFWEIALLNEEERTASIIAITDVEVFVLTQDIIFELINNWNDTINKDIMKRIRENLSHNN